MTIAFSPLTSQLMEHFGTVLRGNLGAGCWCMYPHLTAQAMRELPGSGSASQRRHEAMAQLATGSPSPGLLALEDGEPVGWIAVAPRKEFARIDGSRATRHVDDEDVWVIPCITVRKGWRGRGIAVALIQAAMQYAVENGAPAVEAYPRAGSERTGDDNAYFGTEDLFARAGFQVVRGPIKGRPRNWLPRLAMRIKT